MLVTLCKLLCASNSARLSPCWYLHAGDSLQATLRKLTKSSARKNPPQCFREKPPGEPGIAIYVSAAKRPKRMTHARTKQFQRPPPPPVLCPPSSALGPSFRRQQRRPEGSPAGPGPSGPFSRPLYKYISIYLFCPVGGKQNKPPLKAKRGANSGEVEYGSKAAKEWALGKSTGWFNFEGAEARRRGFDRMVFSFTLPRLKIPGISNPLPSKRSGDSNPHHKSESPQGNDQRPQRHKHGLERLLLVASLSQNRELFAKWMGVPFLFRIPSRQFNKMAASNCTLISWRHSCSRVLHCLGPLGPGDLWKRVRDDTRSSKGSLGYFSTLF